LCKDNQLEIEELAIEQLAIGNRDLAIWKFGNLEIELSIIKIVNLILGSRRSGAFVQNPTTVFPFYH
jgi:hypothetical protein